MMLDERQLLARPLVAGAVALAGLLWSGDLPLDRHGSLVSSAQARIGRPLTPLSYAGVARRTTRRAVAVGAAAATACIQVVDAYGRVVTRC
jgi:hypothetical protein